MNNFRHLWKSETFDIFYITQLIKKNIFIRNKNNLSWSFRIYLVDLCSSITVNVLSANYFTATLACAFSPANITWLHTLNTLRLSC